MVKDNGIGMDQTTCTRIFEPFFSTKAQGKGTGLGLASVYGTIKNHNGYIELESEPGKGTTFILGLPLIEGAPPETPAAPPPAQRSVRSATILVVDDIQIVREMTGEALRDAGYSTHECADGFEAVSWFREHADACDVVILDLTMPNMSGRECFAALKEIDASVKVIITSGHVIDSEISEILNQGAQTFLQKPFEVDALLASIGTILG
jgi:CheY-like chemotaxis protein